MATGPAHWYDSARNSVVMLPSDEFWFAIALCSAIALASFVFIWRNIHRARIIENTPTAKVRSAAQGYVELIGKGVLLPGTPIEAPLTGKPCLWFRYKIEETQRDNDPANRNARWETIASGVSDNLFGLDDGTGRCVIDPDGAEIEANEHQVWYGNDRSPSHNPALTTVGGTLFGMGRYRYTEERLMPSVLYAIGWFASVQHAEVTADAEAGVLLRAWKHDKKELLARFDKNRDGEIDTTEWDAAREEALRIVLQDRVESNKNNAPIHTLSKPAQSRLPFLIAAEAPQQLARKHRRRALFSGGAFVIAVAAALWGLAVRW